MCVLVKLINNNNELNMVIFSLTSNPPITSQKPRLIQLQTYFFGGLKKSNLAQGDISEAKSISQKNNTNSARLGLSWSRD